MPFDTVLFELEGVLAQTWALRRAALRATLLADGIQPDDAVLDECARLPTAAAVASAAAGAGVALDDTGVELAALRAERAFAGAAAQGITLAPGAVRLAERLAGSARLGVVTRAGRDVTRAIIAAAGLEPLFGVVVTGDDVTSPKPSPESYALAIARLGRLRPAAPATTLALEDAPAGIAAARAAGIPCVAVGPLPAHLAIEAAGALPSLDGVTVAALHAAAGAGAAARVVETGR